MSFYFSLPALVTTTGAVAATGLGITGTVWTKHSRDKKIVLEDKVKELKAQLAALNSQFIAFPDSLKASSETVDNSKALIQFLQERVEAILNTYKKDQGNVSDAEEKVNGFSNSISSSDESLKALESLIENVQGRLSTIVSQMPRHLANSAAAMYSSEGAKDLATKKIEDLKKEAESLTEELFKKFETKLNEEFEGKSQYLEKMLNSMVDKLGEELTKDKKSFSDLIDEELQSIKEKMGVVNDKVWEAFLKNSLPKINL